MPLTPKRETKRNKQIRQLEEKREDLNREKTFNY